MRIRANHFQSDFMRGEAYGLSGFLIYTQISSMEESMIHRQKCNSQSGFMSVEAIATSLFYLIMIAMVTLIASKVMNSGKMATTLSALSILRVNLQYVGTNAGTYGGINSIVLSSLVPGLIIDLDTPTPGSGILPTKHVVEVTNAHASDPNVTRSADGSGVGTLSAASTSLFRMEIKDVNPEECRRMAYYGWGGDYGVMVGTTVIGTGGTINLIETKCNEGTSTNVVLTSR